MKKNLLVALMGRREEEHREFLQELFLRQIKKGSRFRPIAFTEGDPQQQEPQNKLEVFHIWEKPEPELPPLPKVLPQLVVCSLPGGDKGEAWLRYFRANDYYLLLVCLDAASLAGAIHYDPSSQASVPAACANLPPQRPLSNGYPGELRRQLIKNLKAFLFGWFFNRQKRRTRL